MTSIPAKAKHGPRTLEARRLAELARAAGLGESPDDAIEWGSEALALLGSDEPTPLLADVLRWQASVLRDRGQTSDAEPMYRRSLELATSLDYEPGRAHAINCLGTLAQRRGDLDSAADYFSGALTIAERCHESRLIGMLQLNLGVLADIRGNPAAAAAHYQVSLRTFDAANDQQHASWVLSNLGYFYTREQKFDDARSALERALAIARGRGDLWTEGIVEENRGELELIVDRLDEALPSIDRALSIAEQRDDKIRRATALKLRGAYHRMSGNAAAAEEALRHALTLSAIGEDALLGAEILYQFGMALAAQGHDRIARDVWASALEAFERIGARHWVTRVRGQLTGGPTGRYF